MHNPVDLEAGHRSWHFERLRKVEVPRPIVIEKCIEVPKIQAGLRSTDHITSMLRNRFVTLVSGGGEDHPGAKDCEHGASSCHI